MNKVFSENNIKKIKKIKKFPTGFTLVEVLLYVAFLVTTVSSFVGFGYNITDIRNKAFTIKRVNDNINQSLTFITNEIRRAEGVTIPNMGATSSTLVLKMPSGEDDVEFSLLNGVLYFKKGAEVEKKITEDFILIEDLVFGNQTVNGGRENISLNSDFAFRYSSSKSFEYERSIKTAISIRN